MRSRRDAYEIIDERRSYFTVRRLYRCMSRARDLDMCVFVWRLYRCMSGAWRG